MMPHQNQSKQQQPIKHELFQPSEDDAGSNAPIRIKQEPTSEHDIVDESAADQRLIARAEEAARLAVLRYFAETVPKSSIKRPSQHFQADTVVSMKTMKMECNNVSVPTDVVEKQHKLLLHQQPLKPTYHQQNEEAQIGGGVVGVQPNMPINTVPIKKEIVGAALGDGDADRQQDNRSIATTENMQPLVSSNSNNQLPHPLPAVDAAMPMTALEYAAAVVYAVYGPPEDGADLWT